MTSDTHAHTHVHMDSMYARNMRPRIMHRRGSLNHVDKAQELTCDCRDHGNDGKNEISRNGVTSEKSKRIFRVRLILVDGTDEICTGGRKRGQIETENKREERKRKEGKETKDFRQNGRKTFRNYCSFKGAIAE